MSVANAEFHDFTPRQIEALLTVNYVTMSFAFIGSMFIILNFVAFKSLRSFAFKLVFFMAIGDAVQAIGYFFGNPPDGSVACHFQAHFIKFGQFVSIIWTAVVAFTIHQLYVNQKFDVQKHMRKYHIFCWGLTIITQLLPLTTSSYGHSVGWCWIRGRNNLGTDSAGIAWQFLTFYIPLWVTIAYISFVYYRVWAAERQARQANGDAEKRRKHFMDRVQWYPAILIVAYFFATIYRIQRAAGDPVFWLTILSRLLFLKGVLNAWFYGRTVDVWDTDMAFLRRLGLKIPVTNPNAQPQNQVASIPSHTRQGTSTRRMVSGTESDMESDTELSRGKRTHPKTYSIDSNIPGPIAETVKSYANAPAPDTFVSVDGQVPPPVDIDMDEFEININVAELPPVDSPLPDPVADIRKGSPSLDNPALGVVYTDEEIEEHRRRRSVENSRGED